MCTHAALSTIESVKHSVLELFNCCNPSGAFHFLILDPSFEFDQRKWNLLDLFGKEKVQPLRIGINFIGICLF
jgi:hypothetical protein